ncbi:DUF2103 domain-containing protein [Halomontanus rarus]|uniref:DUF2103 domain-containing protein n=1 Tax=Halomontanus rarus TaxID=3034020 RepID=UPI001A9A197E|nr:DUF2103 domain-containing protein [Halovivax sp. TS33]
MECRRCATPLEKPGDFCLVCREANADTIVLEAARDRATITMLYEESVTGETTITTIPEDGESEVVELRNFAGKIGDEIRRKRPDEVYATGDRTVVRSVRDDVHYSFYRVDGDEPVEQVLQNRGDRALDVVDRPPIEKIGGSHTTLIGGRTGMRAIQTVAGHPHVKKVIPGPIDAGGKGSQSGLRAKVTRADNGGNLRMLLRDGSSVQENRVVTTARDREMGERVREDLNEALENEDLR